ncbi:MAG: hypothetical protein IID09_03420 [Candidatus Hydrogenedentes bacterium]|nr:hypothetical protein [Candidatus Hydrogenedentota bacterium]
MGRTVAVLGWCLGVVATALWLSAFNANRSLKAEVQEISAQHAQSLARMEVQAEQIDALSGNVSDVTGQLKDAERTMAMLEDALAALPDAVEESDDDRASTDDSGLLEDAPDAEETSEEDETKKANPFAAMFSGEMSDKMIVSSAKMNVEMQYGDFLNGLDGDAAEQARLVITQILLDQTERGMSVMRGELSADEISTIDYEQRMRDELSYFLTPEELAVFDEYQATIQERMLERSYSMQLNMYASGLTPENRAMVLDVLIEEMLFLQDDGAAASSSASDPGSEFARLIEVYDHVRERFAGVLEEDQQAVLGRFLDQQQSMLEMMIPMMESMRESLETKP